jgi:hypothetical protein
MDPDKTRNQDLMWWQRSAGINRPSTWIVSEWVSEWVSERVGEWLREPAESPPVEGKRPVRVTTASLFEEEAAKGLCRSGRAALKWEQLESRRTWPHSRGRKAGRRRNGKKYRLQHSVGVSFLRRVTDVTGTLLGEEMNKWRYVYRLLGTSSRNEGAMWHDNQKRQPLLGTGNMKTFSWQPKHVSAATN